MSTDLELAVETESRRRRRVGVSSLVLRVFLWALVAGGPVVAVMAGAQATQLAADLEQYRAFAVGSSSVGTAVPEGVALVAVAQHRASAESQGAWVVSFGATEVSPGYFAATVAVVTQGRSDGSTGSRITAYYSIGVLETGSGWVAVGTPSLLPAPPVGPLPDLRVARPNGLGDQPGLESALAGFMDALLTGNGDLSRYAAPTAGLASVVPAPFETVEITAAGSVSNPSGGRLVSLVMEGVDQDGTRLALGYSLDVEVREGRWEITRLHLAHPIASERQ